MISNKEMHKAFKAITSKKVLQVNAGGSTGSILSVDIGDELIKVEKGSQIFYKGESLLMVYCSWRLFDNRIQKPITSWQENNDSEGPMTLGLKGLTNDLIEEVLISSFHDIVIVFKSGKVLSVFCDLTPHVDAD